MLFEKIRRTQKPVFIGLAIVFAAGFAFLGIGSSGLDLQGMFSASGGAGGTPATASISSLQSTTSHNPKNANAWRQLAEAYAAKGQNDQAIGAYESYLGLRPKDASVLGVTAGLLEQRYQSNSQIASNAQYDAAWFQQELVNPLAATRIGASQTFPLQESLAAPYSALYQTLSQQVTADAQRALGYRQTLAALAPKSPDAHLAVAQDALAARSYPIALSELRTYLKLDPKSTEAPQVKSVIKQLVPLVAGSATPK